MKPSFFHDVDLIYLSPLHRLLFCGLWCWADREGRLVDRPLQIKHDVLPVDDCDVDLLLEGLAARRFIIRYSVGDAKYIQIRNFDKHQNPHHRELESEIPAQPQASPGLARERHGPAVLIPDSLNLIPDSLNPGSQARPISESDNGRLDPDVIEDVSDLDEPKQPSARSKPQTWPTSDLRKFRNHWKRMIGDKVDPAKYKFWLAQRSLSEVTTAVNGYRERTMRLKQPASMQHFISTYPDSLREGMALERVTSDQWQGQWSKIETLTPASPATPEAPAQPVLTPDAVVARWNELVPSGKVAWDPSRDNRKSLDECCKDPVFAERFEEICTKAEVFIAAGGDWTPDFHWMIEMKGGVWNWWKILRGSLKPKKSKSEKFDALAAARKRMLEESGVK